MKRGLITVLVVLMSMAGALTSMFGAVESQTVSLVEGHIVDKSGQPLANRLVIIEGTKTVPVWTWWTWGPKTDKPVRIVGITDSSGFLHVVDLPPGSYTVKVPWPDAKLESVKTFTLQNSYEKYGFKAASQTQTNSVDPYRLVPSPQQPTPHIVPAPMR